MSKVTFLAVVMLIMSVSAVIAQECSSGQPFALYEGSVPSTPWYLNEEYFRSQGMNVFEFNSSIRWPDGRILTDYEARRLWVGQVVCVPISPVKAGVVTADNAVNPDELEKLRLELAEKDKVLAEKDLALVETTEKLSKLKAAAQKLAQTPASESPSAPAEETRDAELTAESPSGSGIWFYILLASLGLLSGVFVWRELSRSEDVKYLKSRLDDEIRNKSLETSPVTQSRNGALPAPQMRAAMDMRTKAAVEYAER
ncbi:MAG: hypothetical protein Q8O98_00735, partial [bacterium]|nr:hypothetical protein [bacterium]